MCDDPPRTTCLPRWPRRVIRAARTSTTTTTTPARWTFPLQEACVRRTVKLPWHERKLVGQDVVIRPLRKLRRHARAAVALIQVATPVDVFPIPRVTAIWLPTRTLVA